MSTVHSDVYTTGKAEKISIEKSIDEIRKGNGYYVSSLISTGSTILLYTLILPLKAIVTYHMTFRLANNDVSVGVPFFIYEGTGSAITGSHAAVSLTAFNLNRTGETGSILFQRGIITGAGGNGVGTLIYSGLCPAFAIMKFGSSEARQNEVILDSTKPYLFAYSGSESLVGLEIYWYEQ